MADCVSATLAAAEPGDRRPDELLRPQRLTALSAPVLHALLQGATPPLVLEATTGGCTMEPQTAASAYVPDAVEIPMTSLDVYDEVSP
jgi:hypothetical protein